MKEILNLALASLAAFSMLTIPYDNADAQVRNYHYDAEPHYFRRLVDTVTKHVYAEPQHVHPVSQYFFTEQEYIPDTQFIYAVSQYFVADPSERQYLADPSEYIGLDSPQIFRNLVFYTVRHEIFQRSGPPERHLFAGPSERFFFSGSSERNQLPGSSERQFYPESPERLIVFRTQIFRQQLFCPSEQQRRSSAPEQFFFFQQGNLYCACRRSGQQCPQQSFFTEQQRGQEKFERDQDRTQLRFRKHAPAWQQQRRFQDGQLHGFQD